MLIDPTSSYAKAAAAAMGRAMDDVKFTATFVVSVPPIAQTETV